MNFRITTLFFGLLLSMLWVFGLMIAHKKAAGDQTLIMPSLGERDVKIDTVHVKRAAHDKKDAFEAEFVFKDGYWFLKDSKSKQKARVDGFRIDPIVKLIQSAKHDEGADVNQTPSAYGLDKPSVEVTLEGTTKTDGERKKWKFVVGDEKARAGMAYVQVSERQDRVFAIPRKSLDPLFFKDANSLRSRRLFDFGETGVTKIEATKDGVDLEIDRPVGSVQWTFIKPKYGPAGTESEPEEKKKDPFHKEAAPPPTSGGVKGLLNSISSVQVDDEGDFEDLGSSLDKFGLEPGKEWMRIKITSKNEKNEDSPEILYVGKEVVPFRKGNFRYARMDSDYGVFQIAGRRLEPIANAIKDPGKLRSLDIVAFDKARVDAIVIKQDKNDVKFFKAEAPVKFDIMKRDVDPGWQMVAAGEKKKASDSMVKALFEQMLGKKAKIVEFAKGTEEEQKKEEVKWGLDNPVAEISIYIDGIDKEKKEEPKKDETKKDDPKKDEAKKDPLPELKKKFEPEVTIAIGKIDGDVVHLRRTLKDGSVTRFTVAKDFAEKLVPAEGVELAYLDLSLPEFSPNDAVAIKLHRVPDKGPPDTVELSRRFVDGIPLWYIKDAAEPTGYKLAERDRVNMVISEIMNDPMNQMLKDPINKKWLKKLDNNENLDKFGLKNPAVTLTFTVKKHEVSVKTLTALFCVCAIQHSALPVLGIAIPGHESDPGEEVTFKFGNETNDSKDKPGVFAKHSGSPNLFLAPPGRVRFLKEVDLRDRSSMLYAPVAMTFATAPAALAHANLLMFASPYFTGAIHQADPDQVTKVLLTVRSPFEVRSFEFDRKEKEKPKEPEKDKEKAKDDKAVEKGKEKEKDKAAETDKDKEKEWKWTWSDKEFEVNSDKVAKLVKEFAKLKTDRFAGYTSGSRSEQKLDPKEATIRLDLTVTDGKTTKTIALLIGANYDQYGHFARSSLWPEVIFFVPHADIAPILEGARYFVKPRAVAE